MFTAIIRQHQAPGTPVSAATLTRIRATLRAALNAAIRRGLITDNPAARAELPQAPAIPGPTSAHNATLEKQRPEVKPQVRTGAPPGTRTPNPRIKSPLLCQLS
jgi:hypothetical protein